MKKLWLVLNGRPSCLVLLSGYHISTFLHENFELNTFSASLAVSRALGKVVLICSCSNKDVTKFLRKMKPILEKK
jgi:hypothetical protein